MCAARGLLRCLAVLLLAPALHGANRSACERQDAVMKQTVLLNIQGWLASGQRVSAQNVTRQMRESPGHIIPLVVHNGALYVTKRLNAMIVGTPYMKAIAELRDVAASDPSLAFELLLNFQDAPLQRGYTEAPYWGFNRLPEFTDFYLPHHYVRPDAICARQYTPFRNRSDVLFGRFTLFCPAYHTPPAGLEASQWRGRERLCPRAFFSQLSEDVGNVSGVALDVFSTGAPGLDKEGKMTAPPFAYRTDGQPLLAKEYAPMEAFGEHKYVFTSDGQTASSKLNLELAMGAVVFHVRSRFTTYFEPALHPWVHYVPLWDVAPDDLLGKMTWLVANPEEAERIAAAGRHFACQHLTAEGRACWWRSMGREYMAHVQGYAVDEALVGQRRVDFPEMARITEEALVCNQLEPGHNCEWKLPLAPMPA